MVNGVVNKMVFVELTALKNYLQKFNSSVALKRNLPYSVYFYTA